MEIVQTSLCVAFERDNTSGCLLGCNANTAKSIIWWSRHNCYSFASIHHYRGFQIKQLQCDNHFYTYSPIFRLDVNLQHPREKKHLWTDETKMNLYQNDGKKEKSSYHIFCQTQSSASQCKWPKANCKSQWPDLSPKKHAFHLLNTKLKKVRLISREEAQHLVISMGSRLQAVTTKNFHTSA